MDLNSNKIQIFSGGLIEYQSEKDVIKSLIDYLISHGEESIIFTNINIGRQIDLVLITQKQIFVIEIKGNHTALKGSTNGSWHYFTNGQWHTIGKNFYQQSLDAKNYFKNLLPKEAEYPKAALVLVPGKQPQSKIQLDYKVELVNYSDLHSFLYKFNQDTNSISFDYFINLAKEKNLEKITNINQIFSKEIYKCNEILSKYLKSFPIKTKKDFINFPVYREEGEELTFEDVSHLEDIIITGPSGCGKSSLCEYIVLEKIKSNQVPIFLEGKHYEGNFNEFLNESIALKGIWIKSFKELVKISNKVNKKIILIIDAINEAGKHDKLVRSLKAICLRYKIPIIITTQEYSKDSKACFDLQEIKMCSPNHKIKRLVFLKNSKEDLSTNSLLKLTNNLFEVQILSSINNERNLFSRFEIIDTFIKKLFPEKHLSVYNLLCSLALTLKQNLTFSLSKKEVYRQGAVSDIDLEQLIKVKILLETNYRISFKHETLLDFFLSEALIRVNNVSEIINKCKSPQYNVEFILGGIDNIEILEQILSNVDSASLFTKCLKKQCGIYCYEWAHNHLNKALNNLCVEVKNTHFSINDNCYRNICSITKPLIDHNILQLLIGSSCLLNDVNYLEKIYQIVGIMDEQIDKFKPLLQEENKLREDKIAIRSSMFGAIYSNGSNFSKFIYSLLNNFPQETEETSSWINSKFTSEKISFGQIYFLIHLTRLNSNEQRLSKLINWLKNEFSSFPYNLKNALIFYVGNNRIHINSSQCERLINCLDELLIKDHGILMNSLIIDTLSLLGKFDEDENYKEEFKQKVERLTNLNDGDERDGHMAFIYFSKFDHPHSNIHYEIFENLPIQQKETILLGALAHESNKQFKNSFSNCLFEELIELNIKPSADILYKFLNFTIKTKAFSQELINSFCCASITLGYFNLENRFNHITDFNSSNLSLTTCCEILYYLSDMNKTQDEKRDLSQKAFETLLDTRNMYALDALRLFDINYQGIPENWLDENKLRNKISIINSFPKEAVEISRIALKKFDNQRFHQPWNDYQNLFEYGVSIIS